MITPTIKHLHGAAQLADLSEFPNLAAAIRDLLAKEIERSDVKKLVESLLGLPHPLESVEEVFVDGVKLEPHEYLASLLKCGCSACSMRKVYPDADFDPDALFVAHKYATEIVAPRSTVRLHPDNDTPQNRAAYRARGFKIWGENNASKQCPHCDGAGFREVGDGYPETVPCFSCNGTGLNEFHRPLSQ